MKNHNFFLFLGICLICLCCSKNHPEKAYLPVINDGLKSHHYTPELLDAAMNYQNKDTLVLVLDLAIQQCDPKKADTIVNLAISRFHNYALENPRPGKRTSMKRVKALMAQKYILHGDTSRALAILTASLRDTVPTASPVVKEIEREGKTVTEMLIAHNDISAAIDTYVDNINTCNSVLIALSKSKDYKQYLKSSLINLLLILAIIVLAVFALFFVDRLRGKHQDDEEEYQSVIASLQESTDSYSQMLTQLESQQTDNRREVDMLHRQIDKIQDTMMQRMQTGKIIYEALLRGEAMPYEYKDADSYLIDYVMIFCPEKYKQWQQQYDKLTPRAFTYLILSDIGHDDRQIQDILSISASSVRSIKSRLNARKK